MEKNDNVTLWDGIDCAGEPGVMTPSPKVMGRFNGGSDSRSETKLAAHAYAESRSDFGGCEVKIFLSTDDEDRGGVVIRFSDHAQNGTFYPHAEINEDGCEVHLAGDGEGASLLAALYEALRDMRNRGLLNSRNMLGSTTLVKVRDT